MAYEMLGHLFGVHESTISNYYKEVTKIFHKNLMQRLVYPLSAEETARTTPEKFVEDLPGVVAIVDATGFKLNSKENCLLSRLLYSAYHHESEGFVLFGESLYYVLFGIALLNVNRLLADRIVRFSHFNPWRHFG